MDYVSQERIESKAVPGVFLTFIKMVEGHRLELRRRAAAISAKITPLARKIEASDQQLKQIQTQLKQIQGQVLDDAQSARVTELELKIGEMVEQATLLHETELEPIWIKWGLLKIEGDLTINGEPASPDNVAFGPPELYAEIIGTIRERLGLSAAAIKNSSSPITSTAPVAGATGDTIAGPVEIPETSFIPDETAVDTSQAA